MKVSRRLAARDIIMLVADVVRFAHRRNDALIVVAQFRQHVLRLDVGGIVIGQPLLARNIADRAQSRLSDLADALGETSVVAKICSACSSSSRW
jgi:hypothetical protein